MNALPYLAHGATLALAWFMAIDVAACAAVAIGARRPAYRDIDSPWLWLTVRLCPAVLAAAFVLFFFVPSYWKYEPRELVEGFDVSLTALAMAAIVMIAIGVARGVAAWRAAARRARIWMRHAQRIDLASQTLPAFAIDARRPTLALVGVFRPRLLVTRGLVDALTAPELAASVAHEIGHRRALDNLKRLLMRSTPDVLGWLGAARDIEERWARAAERAADRMAAGAADRCALASALVKVARLTPATVPASEPISTLLTGADVASRVHVLLDEAARPAPRRRVVLAWTLATASSALALAIVYGPLLRAVHDATELLVRSLP